MTSCVGYRRTNTRVIKTTANTAKTRNCVRFPDGWLLFVLLGVGVGVDVDVDVDVVFAFPQLITLFPNVPPLSCVNAQ